MTPKEFYHFLGLYVNEMREVLVLECPFEQGLPYIRVDLDQKLQLSGIVSLSPELTSTLIQYIIRIDGGKKQ